MSEWYLLFHFTNSGMGSMPGAVLVASPVLSCNDFHIRKETELEMFRNRAMVTQLLSGVARFKQGVGLCLHLPRRLLLMPVLSLCQDPLEVAICMLFCFEAGQPQLYCHSQGLSDCFCCLPLPVAPSPQRHYLYLCLPGLLLEGRLCIFV